MSGQTSSVSRSTILALGIGLLLSLSVAIPAAQAQLNVQIEIEDATFVEGAILVTGTVTCSEPTGFTNVGVEVRQPIGSKNHSAALRLTHPVRVPVLRGSPSRSWSPPMPGGLRQALSLSSRVQMPAPPTSAAVIMTQTPRSST